LNKTTPPLADDIIGPCGGCDAQPTWVARDTKPPGRC